MTRSGMTRSGMAEACGRALIVALVILALAPDGLAQTAPFGLPAPRGATPPAAEGLGAWFLQKQAEFHRALTLAFREASNDRGSILTLIGLAFAYGMVHAVGPGHGKAVISGYIVANESALKRGVALAFGAAAVQALIALGVVLFIAKVVGGTARDVDRSVVFIETLGFSLIVAMGLWIVWRKGRALLGLTPAEAACTHDHGPSPAVFAKGGRASLALAAIGAGIRPCTGAIILLVFALSQQLYLLGAASVLAMAVGTAIGTSLFAMLAVKAKHVALWLASGRSHTALRAQLALEMLAGIALVAIGAALLSGLMTAGS
ncbi:MAG: nickel/cobalt transporter [Hyphomicrobiales bacterium]|nr:nickel/cobalt transporter [Hyphomicrobiales bacterium]